MILHYLWKIKNRGPEDFESHPKDQKSYNFGSKFFFHYDGVKNVMTAVPREDIPDGFFNSVMTAPSSSIANVTCIVGANGAGKTSLLRLLAESFFHDPEFGGFGEYVFVIETTESNTFGSPGFYVGIENNSIPMMQKPEWLMPIFGLSMFHLRQAVADWSMVFYSNIFDFDYFPEGPEIKNISTNYLLRKSPEILLNNGNSNYPETQAFQQLEIARNIALISDENRPSLPFDIPKYLEIGIFDANIRKIAQSTSETGIVRQIIQECTDEFNTKYNSNLQERFLIWMHLAALCSYLQDHSFIDGVTEVNTEIEGNCSKLSGKEKAKKYLELLEPIAAIGPRGNPKDLLDFLELMAPIVVERIATDRGIYMGGNLFIELPKDLDLLQRLLKAYFQAITITDFVDFNWSGLSSGQQSMLTMYSRFHSLKAPRASNMELKKNILILIDEGTEYFHPEWQRNFLKYLLDFLPQVYGSDKVIQIIVSTNSPFVLSDMPVGNVIFLGQDVGQSQLGQTFGANIHSLLAHGMFLESTLGAFAEEKIQQVIDILSKGDHLKSELEWCLMVAKLIGDTIVGNELQRMIARKLNMGTNK